MRAAAAAAATRGSEDSVAGDLTKGVVESESGVNTVINLRWTKSKPIGWSPGGREGHSSSMIGGKMYLFGGIEAGKRVSSTLVFDCEAAEWSKLHTTGVLPPERCYHTTWVLGNRLFVHGGEGAGGAGIDGLDHQSEVTQVLSEARRSKRVCFDDLYALDTRTCMWSRVATRLAPLPRKGHSCALVEHGKSQSVCIFGGAPAGSGRPFNDLFLVSSDALTVGNAVWAKPMVKGEIPCGRFHHACAPVSGGRMLVMGGSGGLGRLLNDLHCFHVVSTVSTSWEQPVVSGRPPLPSYGHTMSVLAGGKEMLAVFGGVSRRGASLSFSNDVRLLELDTWVWSSPRVGHTYPKPRYGHSVAWTSSGSTFIFGGLNALYCGGDVWELSRGVERRVAFAGQVVDLDSSGKSAEVGPGGKSAVDLFMAEKKAKLLVEKEMAERNARHRRVYTEAQETIKSLNESLSVAMVETERLKKEVEEAKEKTEKAVAVEVERRRRLEAELRESQRLLSLVEVAANQRAEIWQRRYTLLLRRSDTGMKSLQRRVAELEETDYSKMQPMRSQWDGRDAQERL